MVYLAEECGPISNSPSEAAIEDVPCKLSIDVILHTLLFLTELSSCNSLMCLGRSTEDQGKESPKVT